MDTPSNPSSPPEFNVTGLDYGQRGHLRYGGPIIDVHSHVMRTRPGDPKDGPPVSSPEGTVTQAETMLEVAAEFGIVRTYSMCPAEDIPPLRERFGERLPSTAPSPRTRSTNPTMPCIAAGAFPGAGRRDHQVLVGPARPGARTVRGCSLAHRGGPAGTGRGRPRVHGPRGRPRRLVRTVITPTRPSSAPSRTSTSAWSAC